VSDESVYSKNPSSPIRQGDIVLWPVEETDGTGSQLPGASLATGQATGHSHTIVPAAAAELYSCTGVNGDGVTLLRLSADAELVHEEHCTVRLKAGDYLVSRKRQYDRAHGWADVQD